MKQIKLSTYPCIGDLVIVRYKNKEWKGTFTGKVVRFRTGYVAGELVTGYGKKIYCPWTPKAKYIKITEV